MAKNNIKKLIISILLIFFLIILFLFVGGINNSNYKDEVSIVKKILKSKYDDVYYETNDDYIYTKKQKDNLFNYQVFDLNGNKLYSIENETELKIIKVMKKYYILEEDNCCIYNSSSEKILCDKSIEPLNDYIIKVNNKIVNLENQTIFEDVHSLNSFNKNNYFNVNNYYLIDKKGNIILENTIVKEEIKNNNKTDYLIVEKDNKYYTFFPRIEKIVGDGFNSYNIKDKVYINTNNGSYIIYKTGLRKKIKTSDLTIIDNKYEIKNKDDKNYIFVTNNENNKSGLIDLKTNKFIYIKKGNISKINKTNKNYYSLKINDKYYLYDLNKLKIIYSSLYDLSQILVFDNNYKTVLSKKDYILLNENDKVIKKSDKQLVLYYNKIKIGKVNNEFELYNLKNKKTYSSKKVIINNNIFYLYKNDNKQILIDNNFIKEYSSEKYLSYTENTIIRENDNKIYFYNLETKKTYIYTLEDNNIVIETIFKNCIVISGNNKIIIVNFKGDILKEIKNSTIKNLYYSDELGKLIIITNEIKDEENVRSSYLAE